MSNVDLVQLTQETKKLTAMVVEDEKVANELLSSTFKNFFSDVKSCFNGREALEAIKSDVAVAETTVTEVEALLANGDLIGSNDKIKAAKEKATSIKTELEEAIAKKGGK